MRVAADSARIGAYVEKLCGIHLSESKRYLLETRLSRIMILEDCENFDELVVAAERPSSALLRQKIIDAMTTNETLWFRDQAPWAILESELLRRWASEFATGKRKRLRVWSAACSTGQEPYSVLMRIHQFNGRRKGYVPLDRVEVLATDISRGALRVAESGRYDVMAVKRGLPEELRDAHFRKDGAAWQISKRLRDRVRFETCNLVESFARLGRFDLILCRNVLIYFANECKRDVAERLAHRLEANGALIIGASESLTGLDVGLETKRSEGYFYYSKGGI